MDQHGRKTRNLPGTSVPGRNQTGNGPCPDCEHCLRHSQPDRPTPWQPLAAQEFARDQRPHLRMSSAGKCPRAQAYSLVPRRLCQPNGRIVCRRCSNSHIRPEAAAIGRRSG